jgi:preprotein translocase subunit SecA
MRAAHTMLSALGCPGSQPPLSLTADGASLWADAAPTAADPPARRLASIASHRPDTEPSWLDRTGRSLAAKLHALRRPAATLHVRAAAIRRQAEPLRALDEAALHEHLMRQAEACRLQGRDPGPAATRLREQALAAASVAVERAFGFVPHVVQLMGALALLEGHMVEMATGEGKTVTVAMAAVVAAWRGLPCHVITANEYLATRDAELGAKLFALCRLSVASVDTGLAPPARAAAYGHDVVYTTAQNLLADHLRDGLALGRSPSRARFSLARARAGTQPGTGAVVLRGLAQVIVDEADSVLIDEAVTPLIISAQHPDDLLDQAAGDAVALARQLAADEDFRVHRALRHVELTARGQAHVAQVAGGMAPFWRHRERARELVEMALYAQHLLVRDLHYIVEDGKVVLVDELTGRLARQRTLSLGMQQILEASEGLEISPPAQVSARLSFQRFFRLFPQLGGMTGTAQEARGEFAAVYGLPTLPVPTHRPLRRQHLPLQLCTDEAAKFEAISHRALALRAGGRAVLIGMRSVRSSQALHQHLCALAPDAEVAVLHAVNHDQESAIVARAGQPGAITIATNMAGRGTDIALHESVREAGGLHVVIGESNDFRRIDRQLAGRSARQGDPGSVQRFAAFDDELPVRFAPAGLRRLWQWQHRHLPSGDGLMTAAVLWWAQRQAERLAFTQRRATLRQDIHLDKTGL